MFGALVGLKTEEEPNEDDGPWLLEDTITLPSQYKYRKKRLPDWRKAHDFTQPRLVKSTSMLGAIKDDVGAFLFGPAQLSAAAKAWERRKRKKLQNFRMPETLFVVAVHCVCAMLCYCLNFRQITRP